MNESAEHPPQATPATPASDQDRQPSTPPQELRLEKVRKVYVRDLEERERVHTVFLVTRKARNVGRSGKSYLSMLLSDKTGDIDARIFDGIEQVESLFSAGDYVLVQGEVISFHGKPQILISSLERLDPEPIDRKEFTSPQHQSDPKRIVAQIRDLVGRVHDPYVKALLLAFLEEPQVSERLQRAARGNQDAHRTLSEHILSVMKLANRVADHYSMVDRDLLLAGALLHDIGKLREVSAEKGGQTDESRLVGHLVMTAQAIHQKAAQIPGFPQALEHHITHLVLSHLGSPEQGSPKAPVTLEAMLLHSIDFMDSQVSSWLDLMEKDPNEKWTEPSKLYHRQLWKGVIPTARNKAPVEHRPRKRNGADRRKTSAHVAPSQESRSEESRDEERRESSLPKDMTFKPLSEIAAEPAPPASSDEGTPTS
jgi:3'-5' exoribonuclease